MSDPFVAIDVDVQFLEKIFNQLDVKLSEISGTPGSSPPTKGVVILGYDGTKLQRLKTTSDGKVVCHLE